MICNMVEKGNSMSKIDLFEKFDDIQEASTEEDETKQKKQDLITSRKEMELYIKLHISNHRPG